MRLRNSTVAQAWADTESRKFALCLPTPFLLSFLPDFRQKENRPESDKLAGILRRSPSRSREQCSTTNCQGQCATGDKRQRIAYPHYSLYVKSNR